VHVAVEDADPRDAIFECSAHAATIRPLNV